MVVESTGRNSHQGGQTDRPFQFFCPIIFLPTEDVASGYSVSMGAQLIQASFTAMPKLSESVIPSAVSS